MKLKPLFVGLLWLLPFPMGAAQNVHTADITEDVVCSPDYFKIEASARNGRTIGIWFNGREVKSYREIKTGEDVFGIVFKYGALMEDSNSLYFTPVNGKKIKCEFDR